MNENLNSLISVIFEKYCDNDWKKCFCIYTFNSGSTSLQLKFIDPNNVLYSKSNKILMKEKKFRSELREKYNILLNDINNRFNTYELQIFPNKSFEEKFYWDEDKEREEKLVNANMFCYWLDDNMINYIFDYQKENNLLIPVLDEDGDFSHHEQSWDTGIFTFRIKNDKVDSLIELTFHGETKILPLTLPAYLETAIINHHKITHSELKNEWKSWNVLKLKTRHRGMPMGEKERYVFYRLVEDEIA